MKKIFQFFYNTPVKGDVGLEIEVEGSGLNEVVTDQWSTVRDNSLRGDYPTHAAEYVSRGALAIDKVPEALTALRAALPKAKFNFSFRTSVHVHVNVHNLTEDQLFGFIYTAMLLEGPLSSLCGESRKCNRFCLRVVDAEGTVDVFTKLITNGVGSFIRNNDENQNRYSFTNLASIRKHGTVEFRGMEGNLDVERLTQWCNILIRIRDWSAKFNDMIEIYNYIVENGTANFIQEVFDGIVMFDAAAVNEVNTNFSLTLDCPMLYKVYRNKVVVKEEKPIVNDHMLDAIPLEALRFDIGNDVGLRPAPVPLVVARPRKVRNPNLFNFGDFGV